MEISTLLLSYVVTVKRKMEISQNFVAFSEYMNFTENIGSNYEKLLRAVFYVFMSKKSLKSKMAKNAENNYYECYILVSLILPSSKIVTPA